MTDVVKPYNKPSAVMINGLTTYRAIEDSANPKDIMQRIRIAKLLKATVDALISEAEGKRDKLINDLNEET